MTLQNLIRDGWRSFVALVLGVTMSLALFRLAQIGFPVPKDGAVDGMRSVAFWASGLLFGLCAVALRECFARLLRAESMFLPTRFGQRDAAEG